MHQYPHNPGSYVGDYFILNFMPGDRSFLSTYNGLRGQLLGFKKKLRPVMPHDTNGLFKEPGLYEVLGDPLIRLEIDRLVEVPLLNLIPEEFKFSDRLLKNQLFLDEARRYKYICELPFIPYNIGDTVLISQHARYDNDFISEILDISFKGTGVYYVICPDNKVDEIRVDKIIDIVQRGEISEIERLGLQLKRTELPFELRILQSKFEDDD